MKKLFCLLIIALMGMNLLAKEENLSNKDISLDFSIKNKNVIISQITHVQSGRKFLKNPDKYLWEITARKDGKDYRLLPKNAKNLITDKKGDQITFVWTDVQTSDMTGGFDVSVNVSLKGENSYWDINVSPNKEYGLNTIDFPNVNGIDAQKGDELLWPHRGGQLLHSFDGEGFEIPSYWVYKNAREIGFNGPATFQMVSLEKNNVSLYFCPEDFQQSCKAVFMNLGEDNNIDYRCNNKAYWQNKPGEGFKLEYPFNIAVIKGDWYNACKKYRKWGIDNNYGVFANGRMEDRKDLPDWFKLNNMWFNQTEWQRYGIESIIRSQKELDVPAIVHMYCYSENMFDTHYPNQLPFKAHALGEFKELQKNNMHVMPYTNGHLVDVNNSEYYKEYGDSLLKMNEDGSYQGEAWANYVGAQNVVGCMESEFSNLLYKEAGRLMDALGFDAFYMDQVGGCEYFPCFNKSHKHPFASGYNTPIYNKLIKDIRKSLSEKRGEGVPITTEDGCDMYAFDGYLRCNEGDPIMLNTPICQTIYGDYAASFGSMYLPDEVTRDYGEPAKNRAMINFVRGTQMGWHIGCFHEFELDPGFTNYFKRLVKTREAFVKYFNYGERVRDCKILGEMPTKNILWCVPPDHYEHFDFPMIRTASFNYNGKTLVCLTGLHEGDRKIDLEFNPEGLNLPKKDSYRVELVYNNAPVHQFMDNTKNGENIQFSTVLSREAVQIFLID